MNKKYISPNASIITIESSVLMLSGGNNASFQPGDKDDEYEGDFKSAQFEWNCSEER